MCRDDELTRLAVRKSEFFLADLEGQFRWYAAEAGEEVAGHYLMAVDRKVEELMSAPMLDGRGILSIQSFRGCGRVW